MSESPLFRGGLIDRGGEGEPPSLELLFLDGGDGVELSLLLLLILLRSSLATGEGGDGLCKGGDWLDGAGGVTGDDET